MTVRSGSGVTAKSLTHHLPTRIGAVDVGKYVIIVFDRHDGDSIRVKLREHYGVRLLAASDCEAPGLTSGEAVRHIGLKHGG